MARIPKDIQNYIGTLTNTRDKGLASNLARNGETLGQLQQRFGAPPPPQPVSPAPNQAQNRKRKILRTNLKNYKNHLMEIVLDKTALNFNDKDYTHYYYSDFTIVANENGYPTYSSGDFNTLSNTVKTKLMNKIIEYTNKAFQTNVNINKQNNSVVDDMKDLMANVYGLSNQDPDIQKLLDGVFYAGMNSGRETAAKKLFFGTSGQFSIGSLGAGSWRKAGITASNVAAVVGTEMQKYINTLYREINLPSLEKGLLIKKIKDLLDEEQKASGATDFSLIAHQTNTDEASRRRGRYDTLINKKLDEAVEKLDSKMVNYKLLSDYEKTEISKMVKQYFRFSKMIQALHSQTVQNLPLYNTGKKDAKGNAIMFDPFSAIIGAYGGSANALAGVGLEETVTIATNAIVRHRNKGLSKVEQDLKGTIRAVQTGQKGKLGIDTLIKYTKDQKLIDELTQDRKIAKNNSKNDVTFIATKNGVSSTIGLSVKKVNGVSVQNDGFLKFSSAARMGAESGSRLTLEFLTKEIFNLSNKNFVKTSVYSTLFSHGSSSTASDLRSIVNHYKLMIARIAAFQALVGHGGTSIDRATVLVINGRMIPMYKVIQKMLNFTSKELAQAMTVKITGGSGKDAQVIFNSFDSLTKSDLTKINVWNGKDILKTNRDDAYKRSEMINDFMVKTACSSVHFELAHLLKDLKV